MVRVRRTDGSGPELLLQEAAEVAGRGAADLQQVAVFARDVVHLLHLRQRGASWAPVVLLGQPVVDLDGDEGEQTPAQRLRVEPGVIAAHDAALFELADPLVHRGGGEADPARDLGVADAGIGLQQRQDLEIDFVHNADNSSRYAVDSSIYLTSIPMNQLSRSVYCRSLTVACQRP